MPAARRSAQGTGRLADLYASSKQRNLHGLTRKTRAQPNAWRKPALSLSAAKLEPLLFCYRRASGIGQVDSHERYAFPATAHPPLASIADRGTRRHLVRAAGLRHLVPSDEGRYAEMAREMFVTGDWITPRYNGYKYFENPRCNLGETR